MGTLMELTSSMSVVERKMQQFHEHRAGYPQRIDHYQVVTYDVRKATEFWANLGMRIAECTAADQDDELWGMPASNRWFFEASEFPGETVHEPLLQATPQTLETYLGLH